MLPGESRRLSRIDVRVTSTGAQIVRWQIVRWQIVLCRSGKSLRGRASTPGPKSCDRAPRPSGPSAAPSAAVAFTSAAVAGAGSEQPNVTLKPRRQKQVPSDCAAFPGEQQWQLKKPTN